MDSVFHNFGRDTSNPFLFNDRKEKIKKTELQNDYSPKSTKRRRHRFVTSLLVCNTSSRILQILILCLLFCGTVFAIQLYRTSTVENLSKKSSSGQVLFNSDSTGMQGYLRSASNSGRKYFNTNNKRAFVSSSFSTASATPTSENYSFFSSLTKNKQKGQNMRASSSTINNGQTNISSPGEEHSDRYISAPNLLYGTAWKKENTAILVERAIRQGFRGIDTACQPKHYREDLVGEAIDNILNDESLNIKRQDLFIQTKFTSINGQDPNKIPYDPMAPLAERVHQSLTVSLTNLRTDYLNSLVMHGPERTIQDTLAVWKEFEKFVQDGKVLQLGISNCYNINVLTKLYEEATIKPSFIQNRFYSDTGYDKEIRAFANMNGMKYQTFWTLTANPNILRSAAITSLSEKYGKTPAQIWFAFINHKNMIFLTGTKSTEHMKDDLEVSQIQLTDLEVQSIDNLLL